MNVYGRLADFLRTERGPLTELRLAWLPRFGCCGRIRLRWVDSVCCPASHTVRTATTSRVGVSYGAARGCKRRDVIGENQHQVRYASER